MKAIEELRWRGLFQDISNEDRLKELQSGDTFYVGLDPTAPSLQVGNLVPLIVSMHLAHAGLQPLILFGGATGLIGDPSGKSKERPLRTLAEIEANVSAQQKKASEIFERRGHEVRFVNNYEWTKDLRIIDFLRDIGKHFPVGYMTAKEVVRTRLEGSGLSFTEFSYMLLQAYDFFHLFETRNCKLQFGGSDQWGNITAGLELIRRKAGGEVVAFSHPLITDSQGKKFGKSEGGALWLDAQYTSPYRLHQFFYNTSDVDVLSYLKIFTFLSREEVEDLEKEHKEHPHERKAQKRLADEVCLLVHGPEALEHAQKAARVFFSGEVTGMDDQTLGDIFEDVPSQILERTTLHNMTMIDLLVEAHAVESRGAAKKLIKNGGAYLHGQRIQDSSQLVSETDVAERPLFVLRTGKKSYYLIRVQ